MLKKADISIVVRCYASDIVEYDRRTPELSEAPLYITQDATSKEKLKVILTFIRSACVVCC